MANIDVSELMSDPDFVDPVLILTRTPTVNFHGQNSITEKSARGVGSVQPAPFKDVQKLPEALRVGDLRSFWVKGDAIVSSAPGLYASVLVFRGQRFQVLQAEQWTNWGAGYTKGVCVAETPAP